MKWATLAPRIEFLYERLGRLLKTEDAMPLLTDEIADLRLIIKQYQDLTIQRLRWMDTIESLEYALTEGDQYSKADALQRFKHWREEAVAYGLRSPKKG